MGTRYILTVVCPKCGVENFDVYYAPTCDFTTFKCDCGEVIDLEEYTGISIDDASNLGEINDIVTSLVEGKGLTNEIHT